MNAMVDQPVPGEFDIVVGQERNYFVLHDLVRMIERATLLIDLQHFLVGADRLFSGGAGVNRRARYGIECRTGICLNTPDGTDRNATRYLRDAAERFQRSVENRPT
jgi:hypothetical protein